MGNFITQTIGRIAGNITQSVISALIVFVITTYIIVDLRSGREQKKEETPADTAKRVLIVPLLPGEVTGDGSSAVPKGGVRTKGTQGQNPSMRTAAGEGAPLQAAPGKGDGNAITTGGGTSQPPPGNLAGKSKPAQEAGISPVVSPVTNGPGKAVEQGFPEERQAAESQTKGETVRQARARPDTVSQQKSTKSVKKRADDIFDELDQEVQPDKE